MEKSEVKFRVWDTEEKKMGIAEVICRHNGNTLVWRVWGDMTELKPLPYPKERFVIMQFTGLTDKNKNEIYEGDILLFVGGTCDIVPYPPYDGHYKKGSKLVVQKLLSGFTLCGTNMFDDLTPNRVGKVGNYFFWNNHRSFEVIGNVYENKDLL